MATPKFLLERAHLAGKHEDIPQQEPAREKQYRRRAHQPPPRVERGIGQRDRHHLADLDAQRQQQPEPQEKYPEDKRKWPTKDQVHGLPDRLDRELAVDQVWQDDEEFQVKKTNVEHIKQAELFGGDGPLTARESKHQPGAPGRQRGKKE